MRIIIEGHKYAAADVKDILWGLNTLESMKHEVCVNYVGYYYNPRIADCVFILPKVLMDEHDKVFSEYEPSAIINLEKPNALSEDKKRFLYEFAVWIYRTISVYNHDNIDNGIVYYRLVTQMGNGRKQKSNTFLDVILSILQFNKENQKFFMFVLKNIHAGYNKINWTRTIAHSSAIVQEDSPLYLNPINKKRQINFDEELIVIFFSILQYISDMYGFPVKIQMGYTLLKGKQFEHYIKGFGKTRLRQIKYKYYSDKALQIWELCYAFFDKAYQIAINTNQQEYLLVQNFNIVFEAIIDELIGDSREKIPSGLKDQKDGKRVDHMYSHRDLTTCEDDKSTYYIGDSKYYKLGNNISDESVYKQYTYARNVIQWNLNLFMNDDKQRFNEPKYRDEVTEGYNIVPNFFISAKMNEDLSYSDNITQTNKGKKTFMSMQFKNRLFDRDTLLINHYDVNFLYVVSLYAKRNQYLKATWKEKVRKMFREEIQKMLKEKYDFYAMAARPSVDAKAYLKAHFQDVLGKVFTPYGDNSIMSLALDVEDSMKENEALLSQLSQYFVIERCAMGQNPMDVLEAPLQKATAPLTTTRKDGVLMVMMEGFDIKKQNFLNVGIIAIALKNTPERQYIIDNLSSVEYIMFHTRKDEGQHLFKVEKPYRIMVADEIGGSVYKNTKTDSLYAVIKFSNNELDSSSLHSRKAQCEKGTRYDSQYCSITQLKTILK